MEIVKWILVTSTALTLGYRVKNEAGEFVKNIRLCKKEKGSTKFKTKVRLTSNVARIIFCYATFDIWKGLSIKRQIVSILVALYLRFFAVYDFAVLVKYIGEMCDFFKKYTDNVFA